MAEEYSIAMFEDGTTDVIPNSWIQDYLKKDDQFEETKYKIEGNFFYLQSIMKSNKFLVKVKRYDLKLFYFDSYKYYV